MFGIDSNTNPSTPIASYSSNSEIRCSAGPIGSRAFCSSVIPSPWTSRSRAIFAPSSTSAGRITVVFTISDGSRPKSSACLLTTAILCATSSGVPRALRMSPYRPSVRSVRFSPLPPTMIWMKSPPVRSACFGCARGANGALSSR